VRDNVPLTIAVIALLLECFTRVLGYFTHVASSARERDTCIPISTFSNHFGFNDRLINVCGTTSSGLENWLPAGFHTGRVLAGLRACIRKAGVLRHRERVVRSPHPWETVD